MISTLIRKKELVLFISGALSFGLQAGSAFATTVNLNFSNPTLDLSGNGSLDIASLLSLPANTVANFTDGSATFKFYAGILGKAYIGTEYVDTGVTGNYYCGFQCNRLVPIINAYSTYVMPSQTAQITVGSTSTLASSTSYTGTQYTGRDDDNGQAIYIKFSTITDTSFASSAMLPLDYTALTALNASGAMDFQSVFSNTAMGLYSATFTGNYSVMAVPDDPSEVPVPAAAWLFASGLGAFGAAKRRSKKA